MTVPTDSPTLQGNPRQYLLLVNVVSIVVPLVVALLLGIRTKYDLGTWTKVLPHVIGVINTVTSVLLVVGIVAIKRKQIRVHQYAMSSAIACGAVFLVCYVIYHLTNPSTTFGGEGLIRGFYYFILISHILLSLVVLPLVLRAYLFAWLGDFSRHRAVSKYAFPIWLYVSVTGVLAYLMISPYYQ